MIINSWKLFGRRREEQGNDIDKMANIIPIAIKDDLFGFMKRDRLPLYVLKTAEYDVFVRLFLFPAFDVYQTLWTDKSDKLFRFSQSTISF